MRNTFTLSHRDRNSTRKSTTSSDGWTWRRNCTLPPSAFSPVSVEKGDAEEKARGRVCGVAAIQEACDHAAKHGVYLALENHGGITSTPEQLLAIVQGVLKHDWFGVNLDTGNFHGANPYEEMARPSRRTPSTCRSRRRFNPGRPEEAARRSRTDRQAAS